MRTTTQRQSTSTYEHIAVTCDLCGRTGKVSGYNVEWDAKKYSGEIAETTIQCKTGSGHRDGGDSEYIDFDVCPDCFQAKVAPALVALGLTPHKTSVDW